MDRSPMIGTTDAAGQAETVGSRSPMDILRMAEDRQLTDPEVLELKEAVQARMQVIEEKKGILMRILGNTPERPLTLEEASRAMDCYSTLFPE